MEHFSACCNLSKQTSYLGKGNAAEWKLISSFQALGDCVEVLIGTICIARGIPQYATINLANESDFILYESLKDAIVFLINLHEAEGHDAPIRAMKEMSIEARVAWQKGKFEERIKSTLLYRLMPALIEIEPRKFANYKFGSTQWKEFFINDFPICVVGYMGRALPYVSSDEERKQAEATYNGFRDLPKEMSSTLQKEIRKWSGKFYDFKKAPFKEVKDDKGAWSMSASWEKPRGMGGAMQMLADWLFVVRNCTIEELQKAKLGKVSEWAKFAPLYQKPLEFSDVGQRLSADKAFATALATDLLKPYLDHALDCAREFCQEPHLHLPLLPIGIRERGAKVRVPCFTTYLLNILAEPIRKVMFKVLKKDKRCSFSLTGKSTKHDVVAFLNEFKGAEQCHSSDLTRSTDFFPMKFSENLFRGLYDAKNLTIFQMKVALLASGPFRIIKPTEENILWKEKLNLPDPRDLIKEWKDLNKPQRTVDIQIKPGLFDVNAYLAKYSPTPDYFEAVMDPDKGNFVIKPRSETLGNRMVNPPEFSLLMKYKTLHVESLSANPPGEWYLTRVGMQMGISLSIGILFSYNLFCDDQARNTKNARGRTLICGDDALRGGNHIYINAYRQAVIGCSGQFSETKDVMGPENKGIFTEYHFCEDKILKIPKVKSLVRLKQDRKSAPGWITALAAAKSTSVTDGCLVPIREMALNRYRTILPILKDELPLGLPLEFGGYYPNELRGRNKYVFDQIKSVEDPVEAYLLLQQMTSIIKVETFTERPTGNIQLRTAIQWLGKPRLLKDNKRVSYGLWIPLAIRDLRANLETVGLLEKAPEPISFHQKEKVEQIVIQQRMTLTDIEDKIKNLKLLAQPRSNEQFHAEVYRTDIDTFWYSRPLGLGVTKK